MGTGWQCLASDRGALPTLHRGALALPAAAAPRQRLGRATGPKRLLQRRQAAAHTGRQGGGGAGCSACLRVGHACHAAVAADVSGHALQGHDCNGAGLLGDASLLGGHHIHDHTALQPTGAPRRGTGAY